MRIVRVGERGHERAAVLDDANILRALPLSVGDIDGAFFRRGGLVDVRQLLESGALEEVIDQPVRYGAPIAKPEKIVCVGLNYRDHAAETGAQIPKEPILFMKAPNCVVGPDDDILVPRTSQKTDWEIELGVVIGATARYLASPEDAPGVIAGYCLSNDVSEREFQIERGGQWDKGKSCETFNPLGPWLVTGDELRDPQNLDMHLSVNGVVRQDGSTSDMIFGINYIVWYVSQFMVLEPGDLLNTGTPAGVSMGHDDVAFLKVGDSLELSIRGLGTQRNTLHQA
jgi:2-keto-4-pentenoate hydratase/2-oxohepta-3-ene-1,7-dioic acid hydratase in catechol pathway